MQPGSLRVRVLVVINNAGQQAVARNGAVEGGDLAVCHRSRVGGLVGLGAVDGFFESDDHRRDRCRLGGGLRAGNSASIGVLSPQQESKQRSRRPGAQNANVFLGAGIRSA